MEQPNYPGSAEKMGGQLRAHPFKYGNYMNSSTVRSPVFVQAPSEKGLSGFAIDFAMGGVSAAVSKSAAAPIERVKLMIQNQDELIKAGRLSHPYKGIGDCFNRTIKDEGVASLWRGNGTNVLRYFPTQVYILLYISKFMSSKKFINCSIHKNL